VTAPPRPCLDCGTLGPDTRCPHCERSHHRKYGRAHQRLRAAWMLRVMAGTVACSRCGALISPGEPFDLDHRSFGSRPSHAWCNRSAGSAP
jgi:hypothetical protein